MKRAPSVQETYQACQTATINKLTMCVSLVFFAMMLLVGIMTKTTTDMQRLTVPKSVSPTLLF